MILFLIDLLTGSVMYYIGEDGSEKRAVLYTPVEKQKAFDEFHVLHKSGEHLGMCLILHSCQTITHVL